MTQRLEYLNFTFTSGVTGKLTLDDKTVIGLITPADLASSAITFKASSEPNGTFLDVYDCTNTQVSIPVSSTASRHYDLTDDFPASIRAIQLAASGATDGKVVTVIVKAI